MLKPYYLGNNSLADTSQKIVIDEVVKRVNDELKRHKLQAQIEVMGFSLDLLTTKTRFDGTRYWFACPLCHRRVRTIYKHPTSCQVGCRLCLGMKYRKQRFNGMIEAGYS